MRENSSPRQKVLKLIREIEVISPPDSKIVEIAGQLEMLVDAHLTEPQSCFEVSGMFATMEMRLLHCLYTNMGKVCTFDQLRNATYFDKPTEPETDTLNVRICNIRKKLLGFPFAILNVHSRGYRMVAIPREDVINAVESSAA